MSDCMTDDDDLLQHSLNVDDLLKESEACESTHPCFVQPSTSSSIWSNGGDMRNLLSYGLTNGYGGMNDDWSLYGGMNHASPLDGDTAIPSCSQPTSGSDSNWRFDLVNGIDFSHSPLEQTQDLFNGDSSAAHLWDAVETKAHCDEPSAAIYDPFKSTSVLDDLDSVQFGPSPGSREQSPARRSQSACSRPTFADITKKPSSPGSESPSTPSLSKDGPAYESEESLSSVQSRKARVKAFRPAHARHGGYHVPLPIQPDSKYGLDEFEAPSIGKMERSFSCNDALSRSTVDNDLDMAEDLVLDSSSESGEPNPSDKSFTADLRCNGGSEWFDPKRIFQNGSAARVRSESEPCETVLNNTAARAQDGSKANTRRSNASYINNLHDGVSAAASRRSSKQTNADRVGVSSSAGGGGGYGRESQSGVPTVDPETVHSAKESKSCNGAPAAGSVVIDNKENTLILLMGVAKLAVIWVFNYLLLAAIFLAGISGKVVYFVVHNTCMVVTTTFKYLAVKVGLNDGTATDKDFNSFIADGQALRIGLDENIKLPDTSGEAMRRLLTCQHKDSYSILGLRSDATDEEVKRYYRRQAVLVHPDKNQLAGAEEAFKILSQAFDLIGTAEKRQIYDRKIKEEKLSEDVLRQFNDLLTKFQEKMEEASNFIQCNNCGGQHQRFPTDKSVYNARWCSRCQCHHAAKEGDIWAETTCLGFKWHFYACMDNKIYEVTKWVGCQPSMADKFQPNSHMVRLKMGVSSNSKTPSKHHGSNGSSREAELENLLKNLFPHHKPPHSDATPHANGSAKQTGDSASKTSTQSAPNRKGKRRSRKR